MLTILFDGIAYGMLLFILAVGLSVTMGLMNFINLAHGAFAMAGGYITVLLMQRLDVPFLLCLPLALGVWWLRLETGKAGLFLFGFCFEARRKAGGEGVCTVYRVGAR